MDHRGLYGHHAVRGGQVEGSKIERVIRLHVSRRRRCGLSVIMDCRDAGDDRIGNGIPDGFHGYFTTAAAAAETGIGLHVEGHIFQFYIRYSVHAVQEGGSVMEDVRRDIEESSEIRSLCV